MAANAQAAVKKPAAAKKKTTAKKAPGAKKAPVAKKKPIAKKPEAAKKAQAKKAVTSGKSDSGYSDKSHWDRKKPVVGKKKAEQPLMKALRAEHRHIATVMQLFADQLKAVEQGELVDTHVVYEIMDYMVTWPDRYHHPREDLIYGRVAEVDSKAADEVDTLQRDHDNTAKNGRKVLQDIERWREGEVSGAVVAKSGRAYIDHMYEHMNVEEKVVFPHIEAVLSIQDWRELAEDDELRAVGDPIFGTKVQREFRNMTRKLRRSLRRGVERGTMVEWIGIEALMESLEVVSMAYESARGTTGDHLRSALDESLELFRASPLTAPFRCAANNAKVTFRLLGEVAEISRDTLDDLSRVNQERKDRVRLLDREPARR
jgi:hemerythrin-like domain-containing protein